MRRFYMWAEISLALNAAEKVNPVGVEGIRLQLAHNFGLTCRELAARLHVSVSQWRKHRDQLYDVMRDQLSH